MNILIAIVIGILGGILAVATLPQDKRDPGGGIIPVLIGLVGSIGGSFAGRALGYGPVQNLSGEINQPGFFWGVIGALVGASLLLGIYRFVTRGATAD